LQLQRCVIVNGWKLIVYPKAGIMRLYDLTNDPEELRDLAKETQQRARIQKMLEQLKELQRQYDDSLDWKQVVAE
jgi:choline-sulfatase